LDGKCIFPLEFLGLEDLGKIGMHAICGKQSLIVYLRERMKKATVTAKRRKCGVGGEFVGGWEKGETIFTGHVWCIFYFVIAVPNIDLL